MNTDLNTNVFAVNASTGITFTNNNYRVYGAGGNGGDGGHAILNNPGSSITSFKNYGVMNGGGGGGENIKTSMYCIKKSNNMTHDLIISALHQIVLDESEIPNYDKQLIRVKIDDKYGINACDYKNAIVIKEKKEYNIYHLILEGVNARYCIYVNGGYLSESTDEKILLKKIGYFKIIS